MALRSSSMAVAWKAEDPHGPRTLSPRSEVTLTSHSNRSCGVSAGPAQCRQSSWADAASPSFAAVTWPRRVTIFQPRPSHSVHLTGVVMPDSMIGDAFLTYPTLIYDEGI